MPTEVGDWQLLQMQQSNVERMLKGHKKIRFQFVRLHTIHYLPPVTKINPNYDYWCVGVFLLNITCYILGMGFTETFQNLKANTQELPGDKLFSQQRKKSHLFLILWLWLILDFQLLCLMSG
jgi:hypothetical protein